MRREKLNRGGNSGSKERQDVSHNSRQNPSLQRNSSIQENNKKTNSIKESKSQSDLRGRSSIEESDRSE